MNKLHCLVEILKERDIRFEWSDWHGTLWYPDRCSCEVKVELSDDDLYFDWDKVTIIEAYNKIVALDNDRPYEVCLMKGFRVLKEMVVHTEDISSWVRENFGLCDDTGDCYELYNGCVVLVSRR